MPRFAANISLLFQEFPFPERITQAAKAGFKAVECQFPYAQDIEALQTRLQTHQLPMVLHNLPAGDWAAGDRGIACLPDRVEEFRRGVHEGIQTAHRLGVPRLNALAGIAPPGMDRALLHDTLVANLDYAAGHLAQAGLELLMEPINTFDIPGFFVSTTVQALQVLEAVNSPHLKIQFDLYHAQRMEGNLVETLRQHLSRIGHIQLADCPGRHEPGTGEIHWPFVFEQIETLPYTGWVGCEYLPLNGTWQGLPWQHPSWKQAVPIS